MIYNLYMILVLFSWRTLTNTVMNRGLPGPRRPTPQPTAVMTTPRHTCVQGHQSLFWARPPPLLLGHLIQELPGDLLSDVTESYQNEQVRTNSSPSSPPPSE